MRWGCLAVGGFSPCQCECLEGTDDGLRGQKSGGFLEV